MNIWTYEEVIKVLKNNGVEQKSLDRLRKLGDAPDTTTYSKSCHNDGTLLFVLEMMFECLNGALKESENVYFNEMVIESIDLETSPVKEKPWLLTKTTATIKYSSEVD